MRERKLHQGRKHIFGHEKAPKTLVLLYKFAYFLDYGCTPASPPATPVSGCLHVQQNLASDKNM